MDLLCVQNPVLNTFSSIVGHIRELNPGLPVRTEYSIGMPERQKIVIDE